MESNTEKKPWTKLRQIAEFERKKLHLGGTNNFFVDCTINGACKTSRDCIIFKNVSSSTPHK